MLSDIEIAQNAKMLKIKDIAKELGIDEEELIPYKAKISQECIDRLESKEDGKLILVTAINPTPAGEGKTTTSVGLAEGMYKIGKKAVLALRRRRQQAGNHDHSEDETKNTSFHTSSSF